MTAVFLSYRGAEWRRARPLAQRLASVGVYVWDYGVESTSGVSPGAGIAEGLDRCDVIVALLPVKQESSQPAPAPSHEQQDWVRFELARARHRGMKIIHVQGGLNDFNLNCDDGEPVVALKDEGKLIEEVLGVSLEDAELELYEQKHSRRTLVNASVIWLSPLLGLVGGCLMARPPAAATRAGTDSPWWSELSSSFLLGMPADVALPIGFFTVLLLMQITWGITGEAAALRRQPLLGQKSSWIVATSIILAVCGVGLQYAWTGGTSWTPRLVVTGLALTGVVLFLVDGVTEARRLGILGHGWLGFPAPAESEGS